mgnify:CR=1 FL=1
MRYGSDLGMNNEPIIRDAIEKLDGVVTCVELHIQPLEIRQSVPAVGEKPEERVVGKGGNSRWGPYL